VALQVPSQLVTCSSLVREVALLAELLAPLAGAGPKLGATFRKALTDMFCAATQVGQAQLAAAAADRIPFCCDPGVLFFMRCWHSNA
jgi:hypothetical protein